MKIQKLVYFAHGWHLALKDCPLIKESIEAWPYGPVVPEIYHELKRFGSGVVKGRMRDEFYETPVVSDSVTRSLIDKVWDVYGGFDDVTLSAMTHRPDTPWSEVQRLHPGRRGIDIPDERMSAYFKSLAERNLAAAGV
jgi:uncharacterized phage-associated protein